MKVAVIGATGLVGSKMLQVLEERNFPVSELIPVASEKSVGKLISFKGKSYPVVGMQQAVDLKPAIAIFSAGGSTSLEWAPKFAANKTFVIDNSSAWRMEKNIPLIVPEVNADVIKNTDFIIANPNCSTIQMVVALNPLHQQYTLQRVVVSTYQSVTGTGQKAVKQMFDERAGNEVDKVYAYQIDMNVIPQIDEFTESGYTKEELKMMFETKKIMNLPNLRITATTVRIPTMGGHSESINASFEKTIDLKEIKNILLHSEGIIVQDDPQKLLYPMPLTSQDKDEVFVGRLRIDDSFPNTLNMWVVSDNLRKGAATNAVQIAEYLLKKGFLS